MSFVDWCHFYLQWIFPSVLILCGILAIRNVAVYEYRMSMLNIVSSLAQEDIENRRQWEWRYAELSAVSYDLMWLCFFIPCKWFYRNLRCIRSSKSLEVNV